MSNKMYIVDANTPDKSDDGSWHVCVLCDEKQARSFALELNRLARILAKYPFMRLTRAECDEVDRLRELDPGLVFDVYDVCYGYDEINIQQWDGNTLTQ